MKVLSSTSELFPFIKTGGLADVTGALPKALGAFGVEVKTVLPGYPQVMPLLSDNPPLVVFNDLFGERAALHHVSAEGLDLFVIDAPALFDRSGGPYVDACGIDYPDNWKRFASLSLVTAEIANGLLPGWGPDIVHTHDWQSALTSVYMRQAGCSTPVVLTVHNLAFQGQYPAYLLGALGLSPNTYTIDGLEYYGDISYLKGGLTTADAITTVSPTYAREILAPRFGMGLQGVLRKRAGILRGIVNGIDRDIWNPETDHNLPVNYTVHDIDRKSANRLPLLERFNLDRDDGPVFAAVSRLTWQKGMDILVEVSGEIVSRGGKLIVLGQGDRSIEEALVASAACFPGRMAVELGYCEADAHLIHAGSDIIVQPSRFEPCGLTQLYALRYGTIPVVSRTGGLAETIIDANDAAISAGVATGFQFDPVDGSGLRDGIHRAYDAWRIPSIWRRLQKQAMQADFSWQRSAGQYAELYLELQKRHVRTEQRLVVA
ncbi:glycogen synthase GlgA [Ciceribacter naphthalenivorans]|nr:glycogen synthase GlgA [Ciceribacter naphthalenivorans]